MASKWQLPNAMPEITPTNSHLEFRVLHDPFRKLSNSNWPFTFQIPNENAPFTPHFIFIRCFFLLLPLHHRYVVYTIYISFNASNTFINFNFYCFNWHSFSCSFHPCHLLSLSFSYSHSLSCADAFFRTTVQWFSLHMLNKWFVRKFTLTSWHFIYFWVKMFSDFWS